MLLPWGLLALMMKMLLLLLTGCRGALAPYCLLLLVLWSGCG
jgi:hypothetical protein